MLALRGHPFGQPRAAAHEDVGEDQVAAVGRRLAEAREPPVTDDAAHVGEQDVRLVARAPPVVARRVRAPGDAAPDDPCAKARGGGRGVIAGCIIDHNQCVPLFKLVPDGFQAFRKEIPSVPKARPAAVACRVSE